jgi:hypothetical protein
MTETARQKNPAAVALGRLGGLAGKGKCSPAKASAARRVGLQFGGRRPSAVRAGGEVPERHPTPARVVPLANRD